jgi:hypothetical protein
MREDASFVDSYGTSYESPLSIAMAPYERGKG